MGMFLIINAQEAEITACFEKSTIIYIYIYIYITISVNKEIV